MKQDNVSFRRLKKFWNQTQMNLVDNHLFEWLWLWFYSFGKWNHVKLQYVVGTALSPQTKQHTCRWAIIADWTETNSPTLLILIVMRRQWWYRLQIILQVSPSQVRQTTNMAMTTKKDGHQMTVVNLPTMHHTMMKTRIKILMNQ